MGSSRVETDPRLVSFRTALDARPVSPFQWRVVGLVVLLLITEGYDAHAIGYVAPQMIGAWHVDKAAFGPVFGAASLGLTLGALLLTPLADRFGARRLLLICVAIYGGLTLATAWAPDFTTLVVLRFLTGLGLGGATPTAVALMSEYAPRRLRTTLVTLAVCGLSLGGAAGGAVALLFLQRLGWQSVFAFGGLGAVAMLPFLLWDLPESLPHLLRDPSPHRLTRMASRAAPGWMPPPAPALTAAPARRVAVTELFIGGYAVPTVLIWTAYLMNMVLLYSLSNWLPIVIHDNGLSVQTANLATTLYQLGGTVGAVLLALLCDRLRAQGVLAAVLVGVALCLCGVSSACSSAVTTVLLVAMIGFCMVGGQNVANAWVGIFYPVTARSTGLGWALGVGRIGSVAGPVLAGVLIGYGVPGGTLFRLCMIPALASAAALFFVRGPADEPRGGERAGFLTMQAAHE